MDRNDGLQREALIMPEGRGMPEGLKSLGRGEELELRP